MINREGIIRAECSEERKDAGDRNVNCKLGGISTDDMRCKLAAAFQMARTCGDGTCS